MDRKLFLLFISGLIVGTAVAGPTAYMLGRDADFRVVGGITTAVNDSGTAIGLAGEGGQYIGSYRVSGVWWRDLSGDDGWRDGPSTNENPTCLKPLESGQQVRLGVTRVPARGQAPGGEIVAWLECLGVD